MIAVPNSHLSETVYRKELKAFYSFCLFVHDGTKLDLPGNHRVLSNPPAGR